ncbi:MAG TPA: M14 family zinc carboxypeptidase [Bacteroidales bacterium]|nr:M14 family zinc carboxypeptidase [Bacteroidales bacterium]
MKKYLLSMLVMLLLSPVFGQGWRPEEMEIKVNIQNDEEARILHELNLQGDIYVNQARLFVIPQELELIKKSGLSWEVLIENLNEYYENFWETKEAYHTYAEIIELSDSLVTHFPDICTKIIYGTSLGGRQLAALKISNNATVNEIEPQLIFDGGIHGDEIGCSENVIRFARDLCLNYNVDPYITELINTREIWLYLMVNPDGRVNMTRYNNNGVDLNRDWGYMWDGEGSSPGAFSQVESKALRTCVLENHFTIHTSYHSGTEFISCPWSYRSSTPPDMSHILQLAGQYSNVSGYSNIPYGQGYSGMYPINGSTKDSNYGLVGSVSWSLEISNNKQPPASQIMMYYNYNRPAMLNLIEFAGYGLSGVITDATTGEPVIASVFVNNYLPCYNDPENGDYHKYVLPGTYDITVKANGYATTTINDVVVTANSATVTDFALQPEEHQSIYRLISSQIPNNNPADPGTTWNIIGPPDNLFYSIGKNGWLIVDMQDMIFDGAGPDIMVFEGDATPEGYTLYAGESIDGPWHSMGTGNGTAEFDFATTTISEARYLKIVDDGDGTANASGAGFDLDGIQALSSVTGPYIIMESYIIDDSNGNNNGLLDPGETAIFIITLKNVGSETALGLEGTLTTTDQYITVITTSAQVFGDIAVNASASAEFTVSASSSAPAGHSANLELEYSGTNLTAQTKYITILFPDYCYPTANCSYSDGFTGFSLESIDNMNNGCSNDNGIEGYGDFTDMSTELAAATEYTVSWTTGYSNQQASLWIDLNDDKIFTDNERLITNFSLSSSGTVYTTDFVVPDVVQPGSKRLRIRANWQNSSSDPCANFSYGETEDYTVIFPGSTLNAAFTSDVNQVCQGGQVQYTDQSTGNITGWEWTFYGGTPSTSTEQNPLVTYENPGTFDVSLTVTDGTNSSTYSAMEWMLVIGFPEVPDTPEGETELCQNNPNTTYNTSNAQYATSWIWELDPDESGTITNNGPTAELDWSPDFSGTAYLKVASANICGQSDFSDALEIYLMPLPASAGIISGDNQVCQNESTMYSVDPIAEATEYLWELTPSTAGVVTEDMNNCVIHWNDDYEGTAILKVRGINDCGEGEWSPDFEITVEDCTGIENPDEENNFSVFPNPTTGCFKVVNNQPGNLPFTISVTDMLGIKHFEQKVANSELLIDLKNLPEGIYYLKIEYESNTRIKKIIINR